MVRLAALAAALVAAAVAAAPGSATTAPESTYFVHITLGEKGIQLTRRKVDVGTLVVFVVRNKSSHTRRIIVGSYKSGLLRPGRRIQFELSFPVPWTFQIRSTGEHVPTLKAKFICTF